MGLGGLLHFGAGRVPARGRAPIFREAHLPVIPFKIRRFLASAALRQGGDFGMVPPI